MSERKQAFLFIGLTMIMSWIVLWGPLALFQIDPTNLGSLEELKIIPFILFTLNGFMPSIIGIVLYLKFDGKKKTKERLKSIISFKKTTWILVLEITLIFVAICGLQIAIYAIFIDRFDFRVFYITLPQIIPIIILGPLSQEIGWRGFLHDKLNKGFELHIIALIIGVFWALWHLPLFFMPGTSQFELGVNYIPFMINIILISIMMSVYYFRSKGSLLIAIFIHFLYVYSLTIYLLGTTYSLITSMITILPVLLATDVLLHTHWNKIKSQEVIVE
ncbi:MAG: CPBP family intramembrane metalloprotease [Firmicutes bacterium]|nr:CPBP family intramembrane metalloprotease [Bacillota bacterium]